MKKIIQLILIVFTLISCSDKSNKKTENDNVSNADNVDPATKTTTKSQIDSIAANDLKIDFPLDSLLSFDSEKELRDLFGKNVKRSIGYYPEGTGEYKNTLLFPDSKNEIEFVWEDDSLNFNKLMYIKLSGKNTDWKTREGITIGTGIKELESHNKKTFIFFGMGWDYEGTINWNEGHLYERKIFGRLKYPDGVMPDEFQSLVGDHRIESSSELAQKAGLVLGEIVMERNK